MNLTRQLRVGAVQSLAGVLLIWLTLIWVDVPVAEYFRHNLDRFGAVGRGLGSAVLISGELAVVAALVMLRLATGHLSDFNRSVIVASLTSVCTYAANDTALKALFGMPAPGQFILEGAGHHFQFFAGPQNASFPSGHMALAVSFSIVMMTLHPRTARLLLPLLVIATAALIVGNWHFVSDVLAGALVGWLAGLLAANLYRSHYSGRP